MRRLAQPGPALAERVVVVPGLASEITVELRAGLTLNEAVTAPFTAGGFSCGTIHLDGVRLHPARHVVPHPAPDATHVAYFSPTRAATGVARIGQGQAIVGARDGAPFIHAHATWRDDAGDFGGHILPHETWVVEDATVRGWGCVNVAIVAAPDPETNFSLFHPIVTERAATDGAPCVVVRVRPNEDFSAALDFARARQGWASARLAGCVGSLIGASFEDGRDLPDTATEFFSVGDTVVGVGATELDIVAVDMTGRLHAGKIGRGNAVCVTVEAVLVRAS